MRYKKIPKDKLTAIPKKDGPYWLRLNRYWQADDENNLFYWDNAPQCNPIKEVAERLLKNNPYATKIIFIECVYE